MTEGTIGDSNLLLSSDNEDKDVSINSGGIKELDRQCYSEGDADSELDESPSDFEFIPKRRNRRLPIIRKSSHADASNYSGNDYDDSECDYAMGDVQKENSPVALNMMYDELRRTAAKMKCNAKALRDREDLLKRREQALLTRICEFEAIVHRNSCKIGIGRENENQEDDSAVEGEDLNELVIGSANGGETKAASDKNEFNDAMCDELRASLAKKTSEARRLARDFAALKSANEALKNELEVARQRSISLEEDNSRLRRRVVNLKRLSEQLTVRNGELRINAGGSERHGEQRSNRQVGPNAIVKPKTKRAAVGCTPASTCSSERDLLVTTMRCLTDLHSRSVSISIDSAAQAIFVDYAIGAVPHFAELIRITFDASSASQAIEVPLLTFVLVCIGSVRKQLDELDMQRAASGSESTRSDAAKLRVGATLRRIGDEIWKLSNGVQNDEKEKRSRTEGAGESETPLAEDEAARLTLPGGAEPRRLLNSANLHVRVLSELIVLATFGASQPTDVDRLVRTLTRLRNELLNGGDTVFTLYAAHDATRVLVGTLRHVFIASCNVNRVVLAYALDALVHVAVRAPRTVADRLVSSLADAPLASTFLDVAVSYLRTILPIGVAPKRSGEVSVTSDTHTDSMRIDDFDWRILEKLAIIMQKLTATRSGLVRTQFSELGVANYVRALLERCEQAIKRQSLIVGASGNRSLRHGSALSLLSAGSTNASPSTPRSCSHSAASDVDYDFLTLNLKSIIQNLGATDT